MIRKIPISGTRIPNAEIIASLTSLFNDKQTCFKFENMVKDYVQTEYVFSLNSGLSCLYVILEALKTFSVKKEVVLPAYTAGSLIVAIKKAGLKPVLCEVSPEDFNLDANFLDKVVSENTLCIIGVHMFGIAASFIGKLKDRYPGIFIIEDVCQSMGTLINEKPVGSLGDIGFFSLNKGKNLSTFGGGVIVTKEQSLAGKISEQMAKAEKQSFFNKINIFVKLLILSWIVHPIVYGSLYFIIERFKETTPPEVIDLKKYTGLQAKLAMSLIKDIKVESKQRYENGMRLIAGLSLEKQLLFPQILESSKPAFNRLPIVFRDLRKRERVELQLKQAGIETSRMYIKPLHHMFDLGYQWGNFPNSVYLAGHLLTIPCHPLLKQSDIDKIINIIKNA